ncbi:MAG TPA: hypothetical protein PKO16_09255 [Bacteroidia bacterium]|jgi:hypothetical protein|nr:hypothetical protein [Bacteroidia bacterium]
MKKIVSTSFLLLFLLVSSTAFSQRGGGASSKSKGSSAADCNQFHQKECLRSPDDGFEYNGQSRSGLFAKGQQSSVRAVFYKGMDYHISVCTEDKGQASFVIKDARTDEVLYDNSTDGNVQEIQITNENTRNILIQVTIPGDPASDDQSKTKSQPGMCAGLLIEHRRSDKTGF